MRKLDESGFIDRAYAAQGISSKYISNIGQRSMFPSNVS